jgi:hypothetical protein
MMRSLWTPASTSSHLSLLQLRGLMTRTLAGAVLVSWSALAAACGGQTAPEAGGEGSVTRTREQVKMLDDLYKTAVVLITEHYVETPSTLSAATAAKALFGEMEKKGWHQVRLVGLTDTLMNQDNAPSDDFERTAAAKLLAGEAFHEEVVTENGSQYLRYATPIPVVMPKCLMCHPGWEGNSGNVGSLSYKVPLVD